LIQQKSYLLQTYRNEQLSNQRCNCVTVAQRGFKNDADPEKRFKNFADMCLKVKGCTRKVSFNTMISKMKKPNPNKPKNPTPKMSTSKKSSKKKTSTKKSLTKKAPTKKRVKKNKVPKKFSSQLEVPVVKVPKKKKTKGTKRTVIPMDSAPKGEKKKRKSSSDKPEKKS